MESRAGLDSIGTGTGHVWNYSPDKIPVKPPNFGNRHDVHLAPDTG
jgi:hypothetical protein